MLNQGNIRTFNPRLVVALTNQTSPQQPRPPIELPFAQVAANNVMRDYGGTEVRVGGGGKTSLHTLQNQTQASARLVGAESESESVEPHSQSNTNTKNLFYTSIDQNGYVKGKGRESQGRKGVESSSSSGGSSTQQLFHPRSPLNPNHRPNLQQQQQQQQQQITLNTIPNIHDSMSMYESGPVAPPGLGSIYHYTGPLPFPSTNPQNTVNNDINHDLMHTVHYDQRNDEEQDSDSEDEVKLSI
jgi:hypothetical protein